jgi:hypothetical protein
MSYSLDTETDALKWYVVPLSRKTTSGSSEASEKRDRVKFTLVSE